MQGTGPTRVTNPIKFLPDKGIPCLICGQPIELPDTGRCDHCNLIVERCRTVPDALAEMLAALGIDIIRQIRRIGTALRNDKCPCGSSKKFKRCCMLKLHKPQTTPNPILQEAGA